MSYGRKGRKDRLVKGLAKPYLEMLASWLVVIYNWRIDCSICESAPKVRARSMNNFDRFLQHQLLEDYSFKKLIATLNFLKLIIRLRKLRLL